MVACEERRVAKEGSMCTILGDINIDRLPQNDPKNLPDIKNLIPLLEEFQEEEKFSLMNHKATRFRN